MNATNLISFGIALLVASTPSVLAAMPNASLSSSEPTTRTAQPTLKPGINRVTFQSEGKNLVGNLYLPPTYKTGDRLPTIVVTGAWTTVKEQMPAVYAQRLADRGFATLIFYDRDPQVSTAVEAVATHFQKTLTNPTVSQK